MDNSITGVWTMNYLSLAADILGIVSFLIGIGTFATTLRIRKKMLLHVEKSDYLQEIDNQVKNLLSYYETITIDNMYTVTLLDKIDVTLDDLQIAYGSILPKDLSTQIRKLRTHIKQKCYTNLKDQNAKRECAKQLHTIASKLAKEKKVL